MKGGVSDLKPLDRNSKAPLFQQIIKQVIEDIQNGRLQPGDKLPPERQLAKVYQVNRSTVNHALEELASLGWITRRQGSGTEISQGPWGSRQTPHYQWQALLQRAPFTPDPYLTELNAAKARPDVLDLYTGELPASLIPDFAFPAMRWEKILAAEQQVTATGYEPLKEAILHSLTQTFSLASHNQDLLITSGSSQGISLILQTLLAPTEAVATEEPSFLFALPLFQSLGIPLVGIPCDEEGILPDALERSILSKKIRFLYLNPTFQNPTGRLMSLTRRKVIVELCRKYSLPIIEDDVFGELDFATPLPKLKALAPELVIYLGSLSKLFGTSIKIGWLFGPVPLIASLAHAKQRLEAETTIFPQLLATSALQSPEYPLNHHSLMTTLETRAHAFQRNVASFAEDWQIRSIKGGLYTWLTWRHEPLQRKDWQLFLEAGLLVAPAFLFSKETNSFRLNYTRLETADLPDFQRQFTVISEQLKLRSAKR